MTTLVRSKNQIIEGAYAILLDLIGSGVGGLRLRHILLISLSVDESFTTYNRILMPTGFGDPEAEYWCLNGPVLPKRTVDPYWLSIADSQSSAAIDTE
jgi:hypothetical protein